MYRFMRMITLGLFLAGGASPGAAEPRWTGMHGPEGAAVWKDAKPPTTWDGATGSNILWRAPLANYGFGMPVVAQGRVFVVCEPGWKHRWPVLQGFELATGKLAWERELDSFALRSELSGAQRAELGKRLDEEHAFNRDWYTARYEFDEGTAEGRERGTAILKRLGLVPAEAAAPESFVVAIKLTPDPVKEQARKERGERLAKAGWLPDSWHPAGYASGTMSIGHAFPSPVTDGERIYVTTALEGVWCFRPDGTLVWTTAPNPIPRYSEFCGRARSPILYGNLFITDVGGNVRFMDKNTGKVLRTEKAVKGHGTIVSPVVIRVDGKDLLLVGTGDPGAQTDEALTAYRLPGGEPVRVTGWPNPGNIMRVNSDRPDTVYFMGGGEHGGWVQKGGNVRLAAGRPSDWPVPPAAVQFAWDGDHLVGKVLWYGIDRVTLSANSSTVLYHSGRIYCSGHKGPGAVVDALTGKVLAEKVMAGGYHNQIADGRIYNPSSSGADGLMRVINLDGTLVAENRLPAARVEGEKQAQIRAQERAYNAKGQTHWQNFNFSMPFTIAGDRILVRGNDDLWCIGAKGAP